jgi:hypothetical protein
MTSTERFIVKNAEEYGIWKSTYKAAADIVLDNREMKRVGKNSIDSGMNFGTKILA